MDEFRKCPHWTRDSSGEWAVCVPGSKVKPGTHVILSKKDNTIQSVLISGYIEKGPYGHLYKGDTSESDVTSRFDDMTILEIDEKKKKGEFLDSSGEMYRTSMHSCTCPDFAKRNVVCEHMLRLAKELGDDESFARMEKEASEAAAVALGKNFVFAFGVILWIAALVLILIFIVAGWDIIFAAVAAFLGVFAYALIPGYKSKATAKDTLCAICTKESESGQTGIKIKSGRLICSSCLKMLERTENETPTGKLPGLADMTEKEISETWKLHESLSKNLND